MTTIPATDYLSEVERYSANNYHPLPLVLERGEGAWVWDVEGKKYLDCLAAYSAVNQGHRHPAIIAAAKAQLDRITLTSRAFHNDQMGPFLHELCELTGYERALPMNSGAEAVETSLKAMRRWAYRVKKVPANKAEIIVCADNFHGRTTTIVSFSSDPHYKDDFGPFTPGFVTIPFGDLPALEKAITPNTAAFFVEPIQCEGGVLIPPAGYLKGAADLCRKHNVLFVADEIQTGLGRTGKLFASEWEGVRPDVMVIGKALSGGVYPVSAMLADSAVMDVFEPGSHGSTFGGNPLAAAIGRAALRVLVDERLADRAHQLGTWFLGELRKIPSPHVKEIRGRGLMIGVEIKTSSGKARPFCEDLARRGILCKETHDQVIRFAPPLVVEKRDLAWVVGEAREVLG